MSYHHY
jgi:hypothetical protein